MLQGRTEVGVGGVVVPVKHLLLALPVLVRTGWTILGGDIAWPGDCSDEERRIERKRKKKYFFLN